MTFLFLKFHPTDKILLKENGILFWDTLPETKSSHLKMDAWKTVLSFWGPAYF